MGRLESANQRGIAGAEPNYLFYHLGHVRLRLLNAQNLTEVNQITAEILTMGNEYSVRNSVSLFHRLEMSQAAVDVGWEGDIEIFPDQLIRVKFENGQDTAPTVGSTMSVSVGYEVLP